MHQSTSALPVSEKPGLSFAGFRLDADGTLLRGETPIHLPPKELAALRLLLANAGQIVTPTQLRQALWGDVHVTADSVPRCLSSLRARLEPEDCIQTIYKRGYRLIAPVKSQASSRSGALPRLAILPFVSSFGIPDYLGSVVAEETMAELSGDRPSPVLILAQDSVFTLARRGLTALEIGEALKADLVLAGTLRALPTHYRLRAEMIRVEDGTQLWVEDLLVERDRFAGLKDELVKRLSLRLASGLPTHVPVAATATKMVSPNWNPGEGLSIAAVADATQEHDPEHREAYEIFQRAHFEWQTLERHRMQDGLQHLLRATELDPALIGARVDLVNLCVAQSLYGFMSPTVASDIVRRAADMAVQVESMLPALGWIQFHVDRDLPAALSAFSLSAHLPHDAWTTRVRSMFALSRHRFGEAIDLLRSAIELDPFAPWLRARLAWALHLAGDVDLSVDQIRTTYSQFPEHAGASLYTAIILAFNGETNLAIKAAEALAQRLPYFDLATEVHAYALACAGRTDEARTILERLQWLGRERFLIRAFTPAVYLVLGDPDTAIAELRTANEARCPWFFQMLADPRLKRLAHRPEFIEMRALLAGMEAEAVRTEHARP